jgi:hypothetical protein
MCWDVDGKADEKGEVTGVRLSMGGRSEKREVSAVDWGKDMVSCCARRLLSKDRTSITPGS